MASDKKGMISRAYFMLLSATQGTMNLPCRRGWERDVGNIDTNLWESCLATAPLVSTTQKLFHLSLLHRAYRTLQQLHKWGCRDSPLCPKCQRENGNLIHMLWRCPKLFPILYGGYFPNLTGIQLPVVCQFVAPEEDLLTPNACVAILRLLYVARKLIARYWISPRVPTNRTGQFHDY